MFSRRFPVSSNPVGENTIAIDEAGACSCGKATQRPIKERYRPRLIHVRLRPHQARLYRSRAPLLGPRTMLAQAAVTHRQFVDMSSTLAIIEHRDELTRSSHHGRLGSFGKVKIDEIGMPRLQQPPGMRSLVLILDLNCVSCCVNRCQLVQIFGLAAHREGDAHVTSNVRELLTRAKNEEVESQAFIGVPDDCRLRPSIRTERGYGHRPVAIEYLDCTFLHRTLHRVAQNHWAEVAPVVQKKNAPSSCASLGVRTAVGIVGHRAQPVCGV